jgi:hypothetical protein
VFYTGRVLFWTLITFCDLLLLSRDVLDELRALWEDALSKTGVCAVEEPEEEAQL